jgi:hypothetical protein
MDAVGIIAELKAEKPRIERAIEAMLGIGSTGRGKRRGRPPKSRSARGRRRRNRLAPAGRRKLSMMMKKRWAERRKKEKTA